MAFCLNYPKFLHSILWFLPLLFLSMEGCCANSSNQNLQGSLLWERAYGQLNHCFHWGVMSMKLINAILSPTLAVLVLDPHHKEDLGS